MKKLVCKSIYLSVPNLAPWREEYPNPRVFDSRKIARAAKSCLLQHDIKRHERPSAVT
jgi:hypothetical protein